MRCNRDAQSKGPKGLCSHCDQSPSARGGLARPKTIRINSRLRVHSVDKNKKRDRERASTMRTTSAAASS
eukprot:scaffold35927_cov48-Attheya_sp.AAC.4